MRKGTTPLLLLGCGFAFLQWLRWPEPPGFDQSLFGFYGHWLGRGWALYRDLWDSKPPGIFLVYAAAEPLAGAWHAARLLDGIAAAASGVLAFYLLRSMASTPPRQQASPFAPAGARVVPWAGACFAALLTAAPCFGGPRTTAQPEVLCTPLLLAAILLVQRGRDRTAVLAGVLLGAAATMKLVGVLLLPLAWLFAPAARRRSGQHARAVLAGFALPLLVCAALLGARGTLGAALEAVIAYPRAYAAEIAGRIALGPALARAGAGLVQGLPLAFALAVLGVVAAPLSPLVRSSLVWFALAGVAAVSQRQLVDYQLALCVPPLALLAACGAGTLVTWGATLTRRLRAHDASALRAWRPALRLAAGMAVVAVVAILGVNDLRAWARGYAAHAALRGGRMSQEEFVLRLGRPGLAWQEALAVREMLSKRNPVPGESILVWGFAPAVYALAGLPPATRYAFHQTLLVEGSSLSQRWPGGAARRAELLQRMQTDPPRYVVVVSGDRSALEPRDSRAELADFPALATQLATRYTAIGSTRSYELRRRIDDRD